MTVLKSHRLDIRPLTQADAPRVQELISEKISRWTSNIPWPHQIENALWWIANTPDDSHTGIFLRGTGLVGSVSLPQTDGDEVGFWIGADFEGQGIATEAAATVIDRAFYEQGLGRIESRVHRDNAASRRVHEKLGYHLVGPCESWWRNRDAMVPCVHFRLTPEDWARRRPPAPPSPR